MRASRNSGLGDGAAAPPRARRRRLLAWAVAAAAAVAALTLLCRTWTWSAPHPGMISFAPARLFGSETPRQRMTRPGVYAYDLPGLTEHLNSEAVLRRLKDGLRHHGVVETWTPQNVRIEADSFSPATPSQIHVECWVPVPGYRTWSLLSQGSGIDEAGEAALAADLERLVSAEIEAYRRPGSP